VRARRRLSAHAERGSGGVLALAVAGVGGALAPRQRVVAAADAGALAAADTALGIHPGVPCAVAAEVVAAHDAELVACDVEGVVATVTAGATIAGVEARATARAGPPR